MMVSILLKFRYMGTGLVLKKRMILQELDLFDGGFSAQDMANDYSQTVDHVIVIQ